MLPLEIKRSARSRSIRLKLQDDKIIVSGPNYVSEDKLLAFVEAKKSWITKNLTQKQLKETHYPLAWPKTLSPGVTLPFLGKQYTLHFVQASEKPALFWHPDKMILSHFNAFDPEWAEEYIIQAYLNKATEFANTWFLKYCPLIGLWPAGLKLKYQKSLYGSLGANNTVHLNWLLVTAPDYVFEYVVVHELSHLKYRSHGPKFWGQVEKLMPTYQESEIWLSNWGRCLKLPNWRAREESNL
jgi:predicted metal-dependent hydrolase